MSQWNPADYHAHSSAQQIWARELMARLELQPHEHLLDIGCGDGKITAELASLLSKGRVIGIDNSAEMIRFARLEFPTVRRPNLHFEIMDARAMTFDSQFDVVFSNAALHWIVDHRPVLAGIQRALKPGGRVLLQMAGAGNAADILAILDVLAVQDPWREFFPADMEFPYGFYAPSDYEPWVAQVGLIVDRLELLPRDMVQEDRASLLGWIRTTWLPYTERVPAELRGEFVAAIVHEYAKHHPPDAKGRFHIAMVRLEAALRRA